MISALSYCCDAAMALQGEGEGYLARQGPPAHEDPKARHQAPRLPCDFKVAAAGIRV